jgi:DHA3 family macrolide efflux protein-like MFS transporter
MTKIETKRLYLMELKEADMPDLRAILQDEQTMYAYEGAFSEDETREWFDKQLSNYECHGHGLWAAVLKESHKMIGQCGLTWQNIEDRSVLEVGYLFNRAYWHKGYASEAANSCVMYAFNVLGHEEVYAIVRDTNLPSMNVAIRCGMTARRRFSKPYRGVDMTHIAFSVRQKDFEITGTLPIAIARGRSFYYMSLIDTSPGWKKQTAFFLVSQNISLFGSSVVGFAVIWHITLETSSGVWMMLAMLCNLVPQVFISLFAGVWADRYSRKHLIMLADGFTAAATLALAVSFLLGFRKIELLLVVLAVRSLGVSVQDPAVNAIYPQLVPEERLTKVQGINQTIGSVSALITPAIGGLLLGTAGIVGAFFVDVVTAALAIAVMSCIRVGQPPMPPAKSVWKEIGVGISYLLGHAQLRRLIICLLFSFLFVTPAFTLNPLLIERSFGGEVWRLTVHEIVWSGAMIASGVFVSIKGRFRDKQRTIALCIVGFGVTFALMGLSWNFISFLVFLGSAGVFWPVLSTAQTVFLQETVPQEMLGRTFSVVRLIITGTVPVAILFYGPLADVVRVETILLISSALLAVVGVLYLRSSS